MLEDGDKTVGLVLTIKTLGTKLLSKNLLISVKLWLETETIVAPIDYNTGTLKLTVKNASKELLKPLKEKKFILILVMEKPKNSDSLILKINPTTIIT